MRRGQAAIEYLMTYGWAILIIIIIGVALVALGLTNPAMWAPPKGASGFSGFQITDWAYFSNGNLSLVIVNKYGSRVRINDLTGKIGTKSSTGWTCEGGYNAANPPELESGERIICNITFSGVSISPGARYSADVSINFTDVGSTFQTTTTSKGTVFGSAI